jgi:uncharacterized protein (DUF1501 family)
MTDLKPSLDLSSVTRVARQAASEQALPHEVVGVSLSGGSDYVEILVTTDDPDSEPSLFVIGAFRNVPEAALRRDIVSRLQQGLERRR